MGEALDKQIRDNIAKSNEGLRERATKTPDDVKRALEVVGHALPDERTRAHYSVIREYLGFLQLTCAVNLPATDQPGKDQL